MEDSLLGSQHDGRSGHTLVELMVALPLMVAVIAAASGIIAAANSSRSLANGPLANRVKSLATSQRILSDVQFAKSVAEASSDALEFSVADRNGDSKTDALRYVWSGVAGDPLTLSYNGSIPEIIAENVHQFSASYDRQFAPQYTLLKRHDDAIGGEFQVWPLKAGVVASQYFVADVPASAQTITISRIRLLLRSTGQLDGKVSVSITKSDSLGRPNVDKVYETTTVDESQLDTEFAWIDFHFSKLNEFSEEREFCFVVASERGTDPAAELAFESSASNLTADTHFMTSTNDGTTWSIPNDTQDMRFYVIGNNDGVQKARSAFETIHLSLQIGDDPSARSISSTRFLNKPEAEPITAVPTDDAPDPADEIGPTDNVEPTDDIGPGVGVDTSGGDEPTGDIGPPDSSAPPSGGAEPTDDFGPEVHTGTPGSDEPIEGIGPPDSSAPPSGAEPTDDFGPAVGAGIPDSGDAGVDTNPVGSSESFNGETELNEPGNFGAIPN